MKKILLTLLFTVSLTRADEQSFLKMCRRLHSLPDDQQVTMETLKKVGSGIFTSDILSCDEVLRNLKKSTHLHLPGGTFEYLFVDSLVPLATLDWVTSLNLSNQNISDIGPLQNLNLEALDISRIDIKDFRQLSVLLHLKDLSISVHGHSALKVVTQNTHLEKLSLDFTREETLNFNFLENIDHITSLSINMTRFSETKRGIKSLEKLVNLENLTLNRGHIDARELTSLPLKELVLSGNNLTKVSFIDHLAFLDKIETLILPEQGIEDIKFLSGLQNLKILNLDSNNISSATFLENLFSLEDLSMRENQLWTDFPFQNLINLRKLNLSQNHLGSFDMEKLSRLEDIDLSGNNLHRVSMADHVFLRDMNLNDNSLRSDALSEFDGYLPGLEKLRLSRNKISHLHHIKFLIGLKYLELNDNKISSIKGLETMEDLEALSLRNNLLKPEDQVCPVKAPRVCDFLHQDI